MICGSIPYFVVYLVDDKCLLFCFLHRFSKLAGDKLTDNNADIADLSDPNRAMKLSEKFGQLYDDEWTDAFTELTSKKVGKPTEEAIKLLLNILKV